MRDFNILNTKDVNDKDLTLVFLKDANVMPLHLDMTSIIMSATVLGHKVVDLLVDQLRAWLPDVTQEEIEAFSNQVKG